MARKRLNMRKIKEVLRLRLEQGLSARDVSAACSIGYGTVIDYGNRLKAAGLIWPLPAELSDSQLESLLFPPPPKPKDVNRPVPDWAAVRTELSRKGVTLTLLWQEYKKESPDGFGYSRFVEMYREWEGSHTYTMIQHHRPGEKVYVDFVGLTLTLTDPETGQKGEAQIFAAATGYSQLLYARVCLTQGLREWLDCHVLAFEFFGGAPEVVVPDNLKSGVSRACRYDPDANPSYSDLARHYNVAVLPARTRKPRDKAKVENGVQQIERWILAPLRNRTFFSREEAQEAIDAELLKVNSRQLSDMPLSRRELFEAQEKAFLQPLPAEAFVFFEWRKAKVGPDYHVRFDSQAYSVPHRLCGKRVEVRLTTFRVEVLLDGEIVASHERGFGPRYVSTLEEHMPESHREFAAWTPQRFATWAAESGPCVRKFVEIMLARYVHPEHGFRPAFGIIGLAKQYGDERLERACARALRADATRYSNVKSILEKGLDQLETQPQDDLKPHVKLQAEEGAPPVHENVRGADYFKKEDAA